LLINGKPVIVGQKSLSIDQNSTLNISLEDLEVEDPDDTYPDNFS